jgi:hypothetical protein
VVVAVIVSSVAVTLPLSVAEAETVTETDEFVVVVSSAVALPVLSSALPSSPPQPSPKEHMNPTATTKR